MPYDARAVANFLLDEASAARWGLTNMALNKVLYFCHGWYLATENAALLETTFEAWEHGPVIPLIYHQFKIAGAREIESRATSIDMKTGVDVATTYVINDSDQAFLRRMLAFYGTKSGPVLRHMSHESGAPWETTRRGEGRPGMIIPDAAIRDYFSAKLRSRRENDVH